MKEGRLDILKIAAGDPGGARTLLVALPGVNVSPEDFVAEGLVARLQRHARDAEVWAVRLKAADYLEEDLSAALERDVFQSARARDFAHVAVLGLSLGAMGALLHAARYGGADSVILLAPFLGNPGTVAEIARAGGLAAWEPGAPRAHDLERTMLMWLRAHALSGAQRPRLYLGFGESDRFAPAMALAAALLPRTHVVMRPGAHDWETWRALWSDILARDPFACGGSA